MSSHSDPELAFFHENFAWFRANGTCAWCAVEFSISAVEHSEGRPKLEKTGAGCPHRGTTRCYEVIRDKIPTMPRCNTGGQQ